MTEMMLLVRRLKTNLEADQNRYVRKKIGNRMDGSISTGLEAQYAQALANINAIVASEGGSSIDIARITVFLTDKPSDWASIGKANASEFPEGPPAMSWIYVAGLFRPDVKVEIEAIAAVS